MKFYLLDQLLRQVDRRYRTEYSLIIYKNMRRSKFGIPMINQSKREWELSAKSFFQNRNIS